MREPVAPEVPVFSQPSPMPQSAVPSSVLAVVGHPSVEGVIERVFHAAVAEGCLPRGLRLDTRMTGSDVGMAALYTAQADLAILGRAATEAEVKAFEWVYRYRPARLPVMNGSLRSDGRAPALAVLVRSDNPLGTIGVDQLAEIFGVGGQSADGAPTWGQLGLEGAWREAPINLYCPDAMSGTGSFFRDVVLGGEPKMRWDRIVEFDAGLAPAEPGQSLHNRIARAVADDPLALGIAATPPSDLSAYIKVVPVSPRAEQRPASPSEASIRTRGAYPFSRKVYAYFNASPKVPATGKVSGFLRFMLSETGQHEVDQHGEGYLSLARQEALGLQRALTPPG